MLLVVHKLVSLLVSFLVSLLILKTKLKQVHECPLQMSLSYVAFPGLDVQPLPFKTLQMTQGTQKWDSIDLLSSGDIFHGGTNSGKK